MFANTHKIAIRYFAPHKSAAIKTYSNSKRIVFLVLIMYLIAVSILLPVFLAQWLF